MILDLGAMRALSFKIPITTNESFLVQEDRQLHFYGILHSHPELQITQILKSTGTLLAGDYVGQFKPGDIFILGSNCPHVFKNDRDYYDGNEHLEAHSISVFLGTKFLTNQLLEMPEVESFSEIIVKAKTGLKATGDKIPALESYLVRLLEAEGFARLITLFEIINLISSFKLFEPLSKNSMESHVNELDGKKLNDVFSFILENYTREITLDEMAEVANMTRQSFCRFFKRTTRKTFVTFLNELRVDKATQLLRGQESTIAEVSHQVGFGNLSHFNRQFLKIKKMTPSSFRSRLRSEKISGDLKE